MGTKLPEHTIPLRHHWQPCVGPRGSLDRPVRGLIFDTGDVLYDATVWRRFLLKVLARLGLHTHYRSFYRVWEREFLADVHCGRAEYWDALARFLLSAGLSRGQIEEIQVSCRAQRAALLAAARLFPCVHSTLERLSQCHVRLAAISDSEQPRETIDEHVRHWGLDGVLASVVCSRDLGHAKPEPDSYRAALEAIGLEASQAAFVGHDCEELAAAAALGMQTIAFNYDLDARADVYLGRFDELVDLVLSGRSLAAAG